VKRHAKERDTGRQIECGSTLADLLGLLDVDRPRDFVTGRNRSKVLVDPSQEFGGVEIPDHDDKCVARAIEMSIVIVEMVPADVIQVGFIADDHVAIWMRVKCCPDDFLVEGIAGAILGALSFRENDSSLGLDFTLVKQGIDHAVGLDCERELDPIGGDCLEVGRPVVRGQRV
jgi:hypothetical protein